MFCISLSESRPLSPPVTLVRVLGEDAEQVMSIGRENEKKYKAVYESKRASPGGPDAQHHSING